MTALVRTALFAAAAAGLVAASGQPSAAQKKDAPKAGKPGVVEVKQGKDDKYRFTVRDADGKFLAMSGPTGFATKADALKGLDALKAALDGAKVVEVKGAGKDDEDDKKPADKKKKGGG